MRDIFLIFKSFIKGKWSYVFTFITTNLLQVVFSLISLGMLIPFLNILFGEEELVTTKPSLQLSADGLLDYLGYYLSQVIINNDGKKEYAVLFIIVILMASIILKNIFIYISRYTLSPLRNRITQDIREDLYKKSLALPIGFFSEERKGDIISRMSNDVLEVEASIIAVMELLFAIPIQVVFYLVIMLTMSWKLFLFLAILLPIAGLIIGRISKELKKQSKESQSYIGNLISMLDESLGGLRIIKAFGAEKNRTEHFEEQNDALVKTQNSIALKREAASPTSEVLGVAVLCVILWFGSKMVFNDEITYSVFILFILIFTQLLDPLKKLSQYFYNVARGKASIERINKIRTAINPIIDLPNAKSIDSFENEIELKNVNFSYDGTPILNNINLKIKKGRSLALVGASGAGKSTLADLIPRFHEVTKGEVLIDGINIKEYKIDDLRALMGIVSQEPILFNDSIENNIALGHKQVNHQKVEESCTIANANFVNEKEHGLQTNIGDRGMKLSGGEKQRLTIARAIYKNPPILILDEATSSLDTVSEKIVQEAIQKLMQNRTSIVIAHRLSTIQNADEIIVLDKGEIKERGKHDELLSQNGFYAKLVKMQYISKSKEK